MKRFRELVTYKVGVDPTEVYDLTPNALQLLGAFVAMCHLNSLPVTITSISEKIGKRVSKTHAEGRAVDISTRGWSKFEAETICEKINKEQKHIAAISASDGERRACIFHDSGLGEHIHLQTKE